MELQLLIAENDVFFFQKQLDLRLDSSVYIKLHIFFCRYYDSVQLPLNFYSIQLQSGGSQHTLILQSHYNIIALKMASTCIIISRCWPMTFTTLATPDSVIVDLDVIP